MTTTHANALLYMTGFAIGCVVVGMALLLAAQ